MDGHPDRQALSGFDALDQVERDAVLLHVASCASCRAIWSEADPARLFALLGAESVPVAALDRLTVRLNDDLAAQPASFAGQRFGWASLAASFLLAVAIGGYLISRPDIGIATAVPVATVAQEDEFAGSRIEVMTPADADVYDLTVGDTQIVMIFDERLDI
jgi:hypothetical protein